MQKICKECGELLDISCFGVNRINKDNYENKCLICAQKLRNKYRNKCEICGEEFSTSTKTAKYCSNKCRGQANRNRVKDKCNYCGKDIEIKKSEYVKYKKHYCSKECKDNGMKPLLHQNNINKANTMKVKCDYCSSEVEIVPSELKYKKRIYCSKECQHKGWSKYYSGKNSPKWNNDLTEEERLTERNYEDYYNWRKEVFAKDEYTCQCCGDDKGGNLVSHHSLNYSEYEELRTELSNGITLCKTCHKKFHDLYGYRNNDNSQLTTFIEKENHKAI